MIQFFNYVILNDPLEQFEVTKYSFIFNSYTLLLIASLILLFFVFLFRKQFFKFFFLYVYTFFQNLFVNIFGYKHQKFFVYFLFVFITILTFNIVGIFPYTFTLTSFFLLPFFISFTFFFSILLISFEKNGYSFFQFFFPRNVPYFILHFLIFIEVVSYFIRLLSLAVRLFANMVAGHALLKILLSFVWMGMTSITIFGFGALACWIFILVITLLEVLIAFLQAYVFTFLAMIYMSEVVKD